MVTSWKAIILVFLGGGLGSCCRYLLAVLLKPYSTPFPIATLLANVAACFVLGCVIGYTSLSDDAARAASLRLALATGFCGGFSTFSTFTADTLQLWQQTQPAAALSNGMLNLFLCFFFLLLGLKVGLKLN